MVRLTVDMIIRSKSSYTKKKRDESVEQYLCRLTHIHLDGKNIREIHDELGLCNNVSVLYLYDNNLTRVPSLTYNRQLTQLYLQNNQIQRVSNLHCLPKLVKLYLGHNNITVLEGLEKLTDLSELHIEHQNLPSGEKLIFDTRSLKALSKSLELLDITGNEIESIRELDVLTMLNSLIARDNCLRDLKELGNVLKSLPLLEKLDLTGNPLCSANKYRDRVILVSSKLGILDGKEITQMAREFVLNWYASRDAIRKKSAHTSVIKHTPHAHDSQEVLTNMSSHRGFTMPSLKSRHFDEVLARSMSMVNASSISKPVYCAGDGMSPKHIHESMSYTERLPMPKSLISIKLNLPRRINTTSRYYRHKIW